MASIASGTAAIALRKGTKAWRISSGLLRVEGYGETPSGFRVSCGMPEGGGLYYYQAVAADRPAKGSSWPIAACGRPPNRRSEAPDKEELCPVLSTSRIRPVNVRPSLTSTLACS